MLNTVFGIQFPIDVKYLHYQTERRNATLEEIFRQI